MEIIEEALNGVKLLKPAVFGDHRGYFYESYNIDTFKKLGIEESFIQDNQSLSTEVGVLRGLHFQNAPFAQAKLVRVIFGSVIDAVVDIRLGSPTYGKSYAAILSSENKQLLYVPKGFAHGFATLEPNTLFSYKCSNIYNKESEGGIAWNDSNLNIDWKTESPILSEKDTNNISFSEFKSQFTY
mgnify:CR=1 FL=1